MQICFLPRKHISVWSYYHIRLSLKFLWTVMFVTFVHWRYSCQLSCQAPRTSPPAVRLRSRPQHPGTICDQISLQICWISVNDICSASDSPCAPRSRNSSECCYCSLTNATSIITVAMLKHEIRQLHLESISCPLNSVNQKHAKNNDDN